MARRTAVIGAGLHGLSAAAELARRGFEVTIFEARDDVGGAHRTVEFAPGFRAPYLFSAIDGIVPTLVDELRAHGLETVQGTGTTVLSDADPLLLPDGAAACSADDRRGLAEFERLLGRIAGAVEAVRGQPLPQLESRSLRDISDLLGLGWRLRTLGKRDMPAALRFLPMSLRDSAQELVGDDRLLMALCWQGLANAWAGPWSPGGGLSAVLHRPTWRADPLTASTFAVGGPGALTGALRRAAEAAGAHVRTGTAVRRIRVQGKVARAIELADGTVHECDAVVSAVPPRTTLIELLEPGWLDPDVLRRATRIRSRGVTSIVRIAASTLPLPAGVSESAARGRVLVSGSLAAMECAFNANKYGEIPARPTLEVTIPSALDPTMAPAGSHAVHVWVQHTPHRLATSDWSAQRSHLTDSVVALLDEHAPGFARSVIHAEATTPADIEAELGLAGGHPYHAELSMDQALYMRPIPGWYRHATPIGGLFLAGPGTHPGVADGTSGTSCARVVAAG